MRSVELKQISQRKALDTNKFFLFDDVGEEKYDDQGVEVVVLEDVSFQKTNGKASLGSYHLSSLAFSKFSNI